MKTDVETRALVGTFRSIVGVDLLLCLGFVFFANGVLLFLSVDTVPIRTVVSLPLLFFIPGYAIIAALYPGRHIRTPTDATESAHPPPVPLDLVHRAAYSFGLSVALIPLFAMGHAILNIGYALQTVLGSLSFVVVFAVAVSVARRNLLPDTQQFRLPIGRGIDAVTQSLEHRSSRVVAANGAVAIALIAAGLVLTTAMVTPIAGEAYTSFGLLTESDSGALVFGDYPTTLAPDESAPLVVSVANHEERTVSYTVVVVLQRVSTTGESIEVIEQQTLGQYERTLEPGARWRHAHTVTPTMTGERLRLTYLLYTGAVPATPDQATAYRSLGLWVSVGADATE